MRNKIEKEVVSPHLLEVLRDNANVTKERYIFGETETNLRMKLYQPAIRSSPSQFFFFKKPDLNFFRKLP